jgi:transcription initiation factor TFIIIB Brf1 subunit/transcription initiation factor TFIIB
MKTLYETDFVEWSDRTAELLRAGRFDELEIENVAEEIASLGKAERKAVRSQLQRLIMHKIKQQIQPERDGNSWQAPIAEARQALLDDIEDSPSLRRHLEENLQKLYRRAMETALIETRLDYSPFPNECPWSLDTLLAN